MRANGFAVGKKYAVLTKAEVKALKAESKTAEEIKALDNQKAAEKKQAQDEAAAVAAANTTEALLKRAVVELEKLNAEKTDVNNYTKNEKR